MTTKPLLEGIEGMAWPYFGEFRDYRYPANISSKRQEMPGKQESPTDSFNLKKFNPCYISSEDGSMGCFVMW